jgi:hypothetical protein
MLEAARAQAHPCRRRGHAHNSVEKNVLRLRPGMIGSSFEGVTDHFGGKHRAEVVAVASV